MATIARSQALLWRLPNCSLAIPATAHLLTKYPDLTAILTVRDSSDTDANTARLRESIVRFPVAKASILKLDLTELPAVHKFADGAKAGITEGKYPPLISVVCNMVNDGELTNDGYEKTFQVNHIAHVALVL
ncbi:hypothetical protein F4779DRAFT_620076 [Xylariaceae sp. FL0662B]|nr:hypothetical protein F4779DRAFT_620076 [Xylariaceae sp. FL0662B]